MANVFDCRINAVPAPSAAADLRVETRDTDAQQQRLRDPQRAPVGHRVRRGGGGGEREGEVAGGNRVPPDGPQAGSHPR